MSATNNNARPHPGAKRRIMGWILLTIGVVTAGVCGASGWWWLRYQCDSWNISFGCGSFRIADSAGADHTSDWSLIPRDPRDGWRWIATADNGWRRLYAKTNIQLGFAAYCTEDALPTYPNSGVDRCFEIVPWPFALVTIVGGGWLLWSTRRAIRRAAAGCCVKCGYDLSGLNTRSPCPECGGGAPVSAATPT